MKGTETAAFERAEKVLALVALTLAIELVLFKFVPDIGAATVQNLRSELTDFGTFRHDYLTPGSVHYARFMGNRVLYALAMALNGLYHTGDIRLHPLRVAAGILTPVYVYLGTLLVIKDSQTYAWRPFLALYSFAVLIGMYVFYPGDLSSLAFLSLALLFVLRERLAPALAFMLVTGLFRETSFHVVFFAGAWALSSKSRPASARVAWLGAIAGVFLAEYWLVRHFFPGPVASAGGVIFDPRKIFLDKGFMSLTTVCSLGLAGLFPVACALRLHFVPCGDWRRRFFLLNCYCFPAWIVFYRMMNGNLSEFRMLLPAILPCVYGIAYAARLQPAGCQSGI